MEKLTKIGFILIIISATLLVLHGLYFLIFDASYATTGILTAFNQEVIGFMELTGGIVSFITLFLINGVLDLNWSWLRISLETTRKLGAIIAIGIGLLAPTLISMPKIMLIIAGILILVDRKRVKPE